MLPSALAVLPSGTVPVLHLDGRPLGEAQLTRGGWQDLTFEARMEAGMHDVAIEFFNDRWVPEMNEDRNLLIRHLTIGR